MNVLSAPRTRNTAPEALRFGSRIMPPPKETLEPLKKIREKYKLPQNQVWGTYWKIRERKESKDLTNEQVVGLVDIELKDAKPQSNYPL